MGIMETVSGHGGSVLPPGAWLDGRHAKPGSCEDGLSYLDTVGRDWETVSPSRYRGILAALTETHYSPLQRVREVLHLSQARRVRLRGRACSWGPEGEVAVGDWLSSSGSGPLSADMLMSGAGMNYRRRAAPSVG